jgi:hypothetical protein
VAVVAGPFLSFRGATATHWRVSALWISGAADPAPNVTASTSIPISVTPAVALAASNNWRAWRSDI